MGASALAVQRRQGNHVTTALDHELNVPHPPLPPYPAAHRHNLLKSTLSGWKVRIYAQVALFSSSLGTVLVRPSF